MRKESGRTVTPALKIFLAIMYRKNVRKVIFDLSFNKCQLNQRLFVYFGAFFFLFNSSEFSERMYQGIQAAVFDVELPFNIYVRLSSALCILTGFKQIGDNTLEARPNRTVRRVFSRHSESNRIDYLLEDKKKNRKDSCH